MRVLLLKFRVSASLLTCLAASVLSTSVFAGETQSGNQQSAWLLAQTDELGDRIVAVQQTPQAEPVEPIIQPVQSSLPIVHSKPIKHKSHHKNKRRLQTVSAKKQYHHTKNSDEIVTTNWVYPSQQPAMVHHPVSVPQQLPRPITADYGVGPAVMMPSAPRLPMRKSIPYDAVGTTKPWSGIISAGYTAYSNMYADDGETGLARLALARTVYVNNSWAFGVEAGIQNGNTMRLESTQAAIDLLGGIPIETTVKPIFDLLASITKSFSGSPFFLVGKTGIAYRRWQFNNLNEQTIGNLSEINAEVQAGVGYNINSKISMSFMYQGIFGGDPDLTVNTIAGTGVVSRIPMQNGALLSLSVVL